MIVGKSISPNRKSKGFQYNLIGGRKDAFGKYIH